MSYHRKRRGIVPGRLTALIAAGVVITGVIAAWSLVPSAGAGRSHAMTMASAARPAAGRLMGAITLANESGMASGKLPPATCQPDSTVMVTCVAPAPGITGVVLSTYSSLPALYAAYKARVASLNNGRFRQNFQDCGLTSPSISGEVAWNHQFAHPRDLTVAEMAAGKVTDLQAAGRVFCTMLAGAQEDIVWTQDDGRMLGWVAGEPHEDVWYWWVNVHHNIVFPGYSAMSMPVPAR
jgi:hypothetical protein